MEGGKRQNEQNEQIEGYHPVLEALKAGRPINKILVARETTARLAAALSAARAAGITVIRTEREVLDRMARTKNHQGIIALAAAKGYASLEEVISAAAGGPRPPFLLVLDGVVDPQNLGALIRTAEAMGLAGVVIPNRRAAGLTAAVDRASAGALAHMPVARVTNLARTLRELKDRGYWIIGADPSGGRRDLPSLAERPLVLVLGGEGTGLHRLVREECDFLVSIPMYGRVNSLNVGAAGAILMHALAVRRESALREGTNPAPP